MTLAKMSPRFLTHGCSHIMATSLTKCLRLGSVTQEQAAGRGHARGGDALRENPAGPDRALPKAEGLSGVVCRCQDPEKPLGAVAEISRRWALEILELL